MNKIIIFLSLSMLCLACGKLESQKVRPLTQDEMLEIAKNSTGTISIKENNIESPFSSQWSCATPTEKKDNDFLVFKLSKSSKDSLHITIDVVSVNGSFKDGKKNYSTSSKSISSQSVIDSSDKSQNPKIKTYSIGTIKSDNENVQKQIKENLKFATIDYEKEIIILHKYTDANDINYLIDCKGKKITTIDKVK